MTFALLDILGWLQTIVCILRNIALAVLAGGAALVNLVIKGLGAFIALVLLLLPGLPAPPQPPDSDLLAAVNWVFPVGAFLAAGAAFIAMYAAFIVIRIAVRWVKAI